MLPLYTSNPEPAVAGGATLVVMHFNINTSNPGYAGVLEEIRISDADVVFIQEVNPDWLDALEDGLVGYALVAAEPRTDNFGIACFTRVENNPLSIDEARVFDITGGEAEVPVIELKATFDGQSVALLSIHPLPPIQLNYARARDLSLSAAGRWAAEQDVPCIVVGDMNATPWSTALRDMQSAGGLISSQHGFGRAPTWPAGLGSLGMIPIDHLLHSPAFTTIDRQVGRARGSDHRPVVVTLGWSADSAGAER